MSREITFAVRVGDKFVDIDWRTGSSQTYGAFCRFVPYGEIARVTTEMRARVNEYLHEKASEINKDIARLEKEIEEVKALPNHTIGETMDMVYDLRESIEGYQEDLDGINDAIRLVDMMDRAEVFGTEFYVANDCESTIENLAETEASEI